MNENNSDEIDLIQIAKTIWIGKKTVIIVSAIFVSIGLAAALLSPVLYSSTTTFIPSNQEGSSSSSLSGVASLVGINLGSMSSGSEIPASMYPLVGESVEFKRLLLEKFIDDKKEIKLKSFLTGYHDVDTEHFTSNENTFFVSKGEDILFTILGDIISISVNQKDGFISISTNMPKSEYAANVCISSREILQEIVISNKIKSAKQNLDYSQKQLESKRIEFENIQNKLGYFNDSNLNIVTSSIINERKKLEAEFQIINAVMVELSKQVEQNKLQVSKDTPVFSVIKEASMPISRSSPKRTQMVLIFSFIGLVVSIFYVIVKEPVAKIIKEINA